MRAWSPRAHVLSIGGRPVTLASVPGVLAVKRPGTPTGEPAAFVHAGWSIEPVATARGSEVARLVVDAGGTAYLDRGLAVCCVAAPDLAAALRIVAADELVPVRRLATRRHVLLVRLPPHRSSLATLTRLQRSGRYHYLEPDLLAHVDSRWRPPDPDYPRQWQWRNDGAFGGRAGADIGVERAWDLTRGAGVRVAVVDKGFDLGHPALRDAVAWGGWFEDSPGGARFTGLATGSCPISRHGTACAGMAIARSGSGSGGCGVANQADFLPIACATDHLGTQSALAEALIFAAFPQRSGAGDGVTGADVISCSLGPNGSRWELSSVLADAIDEVVTAGRAGRGTLLVWAASNANAPIEHDAVAADPRVLSVARSTRLDEHDHAAFGRGLDLLAPGVDVYTTWTGARAWQYATACSLAAPIVAGVAALVLAREPTLTREQLVARLIATARKIGNGYDAADWSPRHGYGRVDAAAACR